MRFPPCQKEEIKMANKILNTHKYCDQKSYDGQPLRPGEVLVPFWCKKELQLDNDTCIHDNFITWKKGGYHFLIGFAPIRESAYEEYMKDFNCQINSFLDTWRAGRCIIGHRPDGTPVTCPKSNKCTGCPRKGLLERYNPKKTKEDETLSLDFSYDGDDFDSMMPTSPSPEETVLAEAEFSEDEHYEILIAHLTKDKPRYAEIVRLSKAKVPVDKIGDALDLKSSRCHEELNNAYNMCCDLLNLRHMKIKPKKK